jgi:NADH-quinone oxidoreductase subunit C
MPADLETHPTLKQVKEFDPAAVEEARSFRGEVTLYIRPQSLRRVCEFLRDAPELLFKFLADVTAVDLHPHEPRFEVVYHLLAIEKNERLRLKVRLPGSNPSVESMVPVWPSANAFEREVFDLMGVCFLGHPDLRRILCPEEWVGHPLRKDYEMPAEYHGIRAR